MPNWRMTGFHIVNKTIKSFYFLIFKVSPKILNIAVYCRIQLFFECSKNKVKKNAFAGEE